MDGTIPHVERAGRRETPTGVVREDRRHRRRPYWPLTILLALAALTWILIGLAKILSPGSILMGPIALEDPRISVLWGLAEIVLGLMLFVPQLARIGAWTSIVLSLGIIVVGLVVQDEACGCLGASWPITPRDRVAIGCWILALNAGVLWFKSGRRRRGPA